MVTYENLIYLMMGLIAGFIIGVIIVVAIFVFSEKLKDE